MYFNSKPLSGDSIYMAYDATIEIDGLRSLHFPIFSYFDLHSVYPDATNPVYRDKARTIEETVTTRALWTVESDSDFDLFGHQGYVREAGGTTWNGIGDMYFHQDVSDYRNPTDDGARTMSSKALYSEFQALELLPDGTDLNLRGYELRISDYVGGPVLPLQYHRALCDYAIAIASAKQNPELYGRHWEMWERNIEDVKERSFNREIVHSIKSII